MAQLAGKLSAETARALSDEASGSVGHLLPVPVDGSDATVTALKKDLRTLQGKTALVEAGDWGASRPAADQLGTKAARRGSAAKPGRSDARLASEEIYSCCGLNQSHFLR